MKEKKERAKRLPTFAESITPIVAMLLILTIGKGVFGYSTEPLLIMVAAIAAFIAFRVGITWDEMMDEICTKIAKGMPAILILVCVGAMVGTWMAAGTIPMMIYYGVQIVNPKFMLVTAFLIEAVVSVVTGTSWGSVATMGVALMGIASALGVSLPATAGACIAGSYFGDKMSPLSDTTNLAPIAAGSTLYEHIGHMFYTTVPATIVSLVVYAIVGMNADVSADITSDTVTDFIKPAFFHVQLEPADHHSGSDRAGRLPASEANHSGYASFYLCSRLGECLHSARSVRRCVKGNRKRF